MESPLKGITVLEFSQYLSGPVAGLRLADLGARVIKIERPQGGDAGRKLAIKNLWVDENSLLFHTINRNKESIAVDLKKEEDLVLVRELIEKADILVHNFRPGVMEKMALAYEEVRKINPHIVYTEISGYGNNGPWKHKPGQDLLVQAISGLTYSTGDHHQNPVPFGLSIADGLTGNQAVQGILAALIRRHRTGAGALLQLSLLETIIDFQFEFFTTYFQSNRHHQRSAVNNGHPLLGAPYGIYGTEDGYIAVAMMPLAKLNAAIGCEALAVFPEEDAFSRRDEIKVVLTRHFKTGKTQAWLDKMRVYDLWVMPVLDWNQLRDTATYKALQMEQSLQVNGKEIITTRCPIRINGERVTSAKNAPRLGQYNDIIAGTFENERL
jgi:crotonobetainyl-CoA:carnitine CoA-transferase CaiB-like acyl-CoA transferase